MCRSPENCDSLVLGPALLCCHLVVIFGNNSLKYGALHSSRPCSRRQCWTSSSEKSRQKAGPHGAYILADWPRYSWVKAESPPLDRGDNEVQRGKTFAQTTQFTSGKVGSELKIPLHSTLLPSHSLSGGQEVGPESGGQTTNPKRAALC